MDRVDAQLPEVPNGDAAGFHAFYVESWPGAVRLASLLTQDASVAEEIAQEAFMAVLHRWANLREPAAYLHRCVTNSARMYHRHAGSGRRRLPLLGVVLSLPLGFDELADLVAELPFRQRAVIVLRYHAGLSEHEIADALGCRPGTVKSLASRALSRLQEELS
jgi:DNA-directed RNA polymerase specialized sigma24 family protein